MNGTNIVKGDNLLTAKIISGKQVAARIKESLKNEVGLLKSKGILPGLAVVIVGSDPASRIYVNSKKKACEEIGIYSEEYALSEETTQEELLRLVRTLNEKKDVHGILVQLPLPNHLNEKEVINTINPDKDVDAFHPINVGKIMLGEPDYLPCTPAGVMELIKESGIDIAGKECVVVGRSNIVGKPQAMLLLQQHGTVTICHSRTKNLKEVCKRADILVVAVGKPQIITGDMIKPGAVVIDVGMNRLENRKLVGDVEFDSAVNVAGAITPVPGGVGPMTIAMLMKNTVKAAQIQLLSK
ncbi:MAG: methylenetetrahydrofolate dehydrogenase / methenyltetrahydrofolate cyclohydrolase [Clostridiales bacterium]|jgi:methylenetetrahydrofolate dehydrogenase (NADP+)/methenyltetrahydrofolate cyclohydrolase|nr:methylenetetrahydrofolate dehydrogenase / methenyltetrahydrofolate cyclohydrolase [Clostridiales bacterium]